MDDVIVVGGGFAGTAAACRLAAEGHRPLLLERAPRLGGRAASTLPPDRSGSIDYGQHILMRCCTASAGFLARVGASRAVRFQETLSIPIVSTTGRTFLRSSPLPGILHLTPSLLAYRPLPFADRLRAMRAGLAMSVRAPRPERPFADWLRAHGQSDRAIRALWDPISIAALNARSQDVSSSAAGRLFRDAFLRPGGADVGFFTAPLSTIFAAARAYVEQHGGTVRTSAAANRLVVEGDRVRGVELASGEAIACRAVVCAIPPADLVPLVRETEALAEVLEKATRLRWAPIVNLHAWYDRVVLDDEFVVAVDSPIQAVFDVTRLHGDAGLNVPTHLILSQSAAETWIDRPASDVVHGLLSALGDLFPRVRTARCLRTLVLRHRRATYVPGPGADLLRARAATPVRGLYLAGDWTSTGWPSTIEGAIRSGLVASAHVEGDLGPREGTDAAPLSR